MTTQISRWTAAAALLLAGLAIAATPAMADSLGSPTRISESGEGLRTNMPAVAYGQASQKYLSVWADQDGPSSILGRMITADGAPSGDVFEITAPSEPCDEARLAAAVERACGEWTWLPVVTYNATAGEFLVVWQQATGYIETEDCFMSSAIMGRRISGAGVPIGEPFAISGESLCPVQADVSWSSGANRYLVTWSDQASGVVLARVIDAAGAPLGGEIEISPPDDGQESHHDDAPAIAYDSVANRWLVVWNDGNGIGGQLVDVDGTKVGDAGLVVESWAAGDPDIAFSATSKEFLVAYVERTGASAAAAAAAAGDVVNGQRLDQAGARIGTTGFPVSDPRFYAAWEPSVAWDPQGNRYTVVYTGFESGDPPAPSVFGQTVAADGTLVGTAGFAIAGRSGDRNPRGLAYNADRCEFLATWEGDDDGVKEIYARRLAGTACPQPPEPQQPQQPAVTQQQQPQPDTATPSGAPPAAAPDTRRPRVAVKGARAFGGTCSSATAVRLRVRARDATALRVTVYVGGKRVRSTSRTRFRVVLSARSLDVGRHRVRIVARDAAGNRTVRRVTVRRCAERVVLPRFAG